MTADAAFASVIVFPVDIRLLPLYERVSGKNINSCFQKPVQKLLSKGKTPKIIVIAIARKLFRVFGRLKNSRDYVHNPAFADWLQKRCLWPGTRQVM